MRATGRRDMTRRGALPTGPEGGEMTDTRTAPARTAGPSRRKVAVGLAAAALVAAIAFDTTVVRIGSEADLREQAFDPDVYGRDQFPRIRGLVVDRAAAAPVLAEKLSTDRNAAIADHGRMAGAFPVLAVSFTGTVGSGTSGIFGVEVDDMPDGVSIRVQTGPAINGTELRDIPGDIVFGDFTNQIEYQDAGAGINRAMAAETLDRLDRDALPGKTVSVTGVFTLINPASWLVTPVSFEVQP
jgi:predicted lipoprotein